MERPASTPETLPLRLSCACQKDTCSGEVVTITTSCAKEIFVRCAPTLAPEQNLNFQQQVRRFYGCLPRLLGQAGAEMSHVVLERAFFENFAEDMESFQEIRAEAYQEGGIARERYPATTYIEQPPCRPAEKIEMQIYAVVPHSDRAASVRTYIDPKDETISKIVRMGDYRHLFISNVKGFDISGRPSGSFREQSDAMFARAKELLAHHGAHFTDVLRTWCYIHDIDNHYDEFNASRNAFFQTEGVERLPASTGIEAALHPPGSLCGIDLYALLNPEGADVEVMHTPTLNEADEYGSAFSRGMKVGLPEKTVLYISGTASVDEAGATVYVGDVRRQLERMLLNVRELLAPHGATFEDVTQIATFLKSAGDLELYREILKEWGIAHIPNTFVEAGVCRPDLLCEMEAIAILPKSGDQRREKNTSSPGCRHAGPPGPHRAAQVAPSEHSPQGGQG